MPRTDWGQTWQEYHEFGDKCNNQKWCRLHWWPGFDDSGYPTQLEYPLFNLKVKSSINGWQDVDVFCGPGAYLPKKHKFYTAKAMKDKERLADKRLKEENSGITDDWN